MRTATSATAPSPGSDVAQPAGPAKMGLLNDDPNMLTEDVNRVDAGTGEPASGGGAGVGHPLMPDEIRTLRRVRIKKTGWA